MSIRRATAPAAPKRRGIAALLAAILATVSVGALAADRGPDWRDLSPHERNALERERFERAPPDERRRMREGARRYLDMPPEQRRELQRTQEEYKRMSPEQRRELWRQYREERR